MNLIYLNIKEIILSLFINWLFKINKVKSLTIFVEISKDSKLSIIEVITYKTISTANNLSLSFKI